MGKTIKEIKEIKEKVAIENGYAQNVFGSAWEFAMLLTHRTKRQILLYEEVLEKLNEKYVNTMNNGSNSKTSAA